MTIRKCDLKTFPNRELEGSRRSVSGNPMPSTGSVFTVDMPGFRDFRWGHRRTMRPEGDPSRVGSVDRSIARQTGTRPYRATSYHRYTFVGLFLFTLVLYFRPYHLIPQLQGFDSMAWVIALITFLIFLPTQLRAEGRLTVLSTEVKCILFLASWALITIPIAINPTLAWTTYSDLFIKIVVIFVMLVNAVRTKSRLIGLMWLSIGMGAWLSYEALDLYQQGIFKTEGYRVNVNFGGMFGNPNDIAVHLVVFMPIALALGLGSKNVFLKVVYFASAGIMIAGNMVTQSRGGFLGLVAASGLLVWKLGKKHRFRTVALASLFAIVLILLAPGNYGSRVLSIVDPSLDPVGSSDQRREALSRSIVVTLRNPLGIGIGNSPIIGTRNLQTHNAYTQVSSELGWLSLVIYLLFLLLPFRRLSNLQGRTCAHKDDLWFYYTAIGIQASIAGYLVSSFFTSVAYQWYIFYPIAYSLCLCRIYEVVEARRQCVQL